MTATSSRADCQVIKLSDGSFHVIDGNVVWPRRRGGSVFPNFPRQPIQEAQLLHRAPAAIALAPVRSRRQPHRKGLGKIFIRMLLRIPSRQMPHIIARKRRGPVVVAIRAPERPKDLLSTPAVVVQLVGISKRVPGLMPQIHHDFARIFEVMRLLFPAAPAPHSPGKTESQ